ncbi:ComF family protein [Planococcus salinus]|uniref:ComF family protein n=2 Tax=Planococcus salinus TaxID=1848460 RepID=A0A3M8P483_9BACL|nr:ComF family protein [Planococcus salinus]
MKSFLHQYKFMQDVVLAEVFAGEIHKALRKSKAVIVPVPMHPEKLKIRTFPQVERFLDAAGLPCQQFLEKSEDVQGTKSKAERLAAATLFQWNREKVPEKVMLVDDLYTTGTTMRHAAKVLRQHGAKEVSLFTLIRG